MGFFSNLFGRNNEANVVEAEDIAPSHKNQILSTPDTSYDFLDAFNKDNWSNASYQERMDAYQALEHHMAKEQGRAERQIVFEDFSKTNPDSPGAVGYYTGYDDKLHMDTGYLNGTKNPYDGMDTVIHEGRHAYQNDCINGFAEPDSKMAPNLHGIKENDIYGNYHDSGNDYFLQPLEYDAHTYASDTMSNPEFQEHFKNDENYDKYCQAQKAYIDNRSQKCEIGAGYVKDYWENNVKEAENYRNAVLNSPSADSLIGDANHNLENSKEALNDFIDQNYTNGVYDIEKAGNSLSHNDALNKGYTENELSSLKSEPTPAQQTTNDLYQINPDREVIPWCRDTDMFNNLDEHPGPVSDSVYKKSPIDEQNQEEATSENDANASNDEQNEENSSNEDEIADKQNQEEPASENEENNEDNSNDELNNNSQDEQQEAGSEPSQDNERENNDSQDEQQEAGSEPSQDNDQENNNSQDEQQEAGSEPSQDNEQENNDSQDEQQEAASEPSQDNEQENNNSQDEQQEAGSEPSQDNEQENNNSQDNQQEADSQQTQDSSQSGQSEDDGMSM